MAESQKKLYVIVWSKFFKKSPQEAFSDFSSLRYSVRKLSFFQITLILWKKWNFEAFYIRNQISFGDRKLISKSLKIKLKIFYLKN